MKTPTTSTRAIIVRDNKLLLVSGDGNGDFWCTPGGRVEYAESLMDALMREVREETGLDVSVGDIVSVCDFVDEENGWHRVDLFFRCEIVSGELSGTHRDMGGTVNEAKFFTLEEIQSLNVVPPSLKTDFWLQPVPDIKIYKGMDRKIS